MDKEKREISEAEVKFHRELIYAGAFVVSIPLAWVLILIRAYLIYVAYTIAAIVGVLALYGVFVLLVWMTGIITKQEAIEIGEYGIALRSMWGKVTVLAPMTANQAQIARRGRKTIVTPVVPSILEDIESGVIAIGQMVMHMGYEESKGTLLPVIDVWPGTFAIAGRGRSGKTRRVLTIIMQAIMAGARVFLCDPHATKQDSLANLVEPLSPWLVIARNIPEIIEVTRYFSNEMTNRKENTLHTNKAPWLIIYDEWSSLMTSKSIEDDDKELLQDTVVSCSSEYAGYFGFAGIIGQIWTEEATGGTAIRRTLHHAFIHQLSAEYAKFFVKGKWANKAEELSKRQCIYRIDAETKVINTHLVPDNTAIWFADWLTENLPPDALEGPAPQLLLGAGKKQIPQSATSTKNNTGPLDENYTPSLEMTFDESDTPDEMPVPQIQMSLEERELQSLVGAWNEGYKTLDRLMSATGFTQHRVRTLKGKAIHQGLIEE